jgi:uncharacterized phage protein gp47/JayE
MAFVARTRAEIRDQLLSYWAAEYALRGETLLTAQGSDAYLLASQIGVVQEAVDAQAEQVARDILPDQASTAGLDRFGAVYGIPRPAGTFATASVTVTGAAPLTTYAIPAGTQMAYSDGSLYSVPAGNITTNGSSQATIIVTATTLGSASTRNVGDVLTFQTAPAGLNPTGTVSISVPGTDAADDETYRAILIARLSERPASGNRADWRAWATSYVATPVVDAYVYPLLEPPAVTPGNGTAGVLGCVTVVALGPAQGDSTVNTRIVPYDDLNGRIVGAPLLQISEYVDGLRTAQGVLTSTGTQLRPVTMGPATWVVQTANTQSQAVTAQITVTSANAFTFSATPTVHSSSTTTSLVVVGDYSATGTNLSGLKALVNIGTANIRGGYAVTTLGTGTYNGGTGRTTFPLGVALAAAPDPAYVLRGYTPAWEALRTAVFAFFDALGPSDSSPASRWPTEDAAGARSTLYRTALQGAMTRVSGVLSATVTTPGGDVTPSTWKTILTLTDFVVTP